MLSGNLHPGQPTAYKPEFCEKLIEHMSRGYSYESFAGKVGVCEKTLYNWEKDHPEFLQSKKIAVQKCLLSWEEAAIEGGLKAGVLNSAVWIFNMKCRFRKLFRDTDDDMDLANAIQVVKAAINAKSNEPK